MHKILRCLCLQYQKQMQLSCFYRGIVLKCLLTKSVPDGKWTVDAPSARAIIHAILFELRPGTRQNDGGLKINTRSSSERRCWDGNICGLCTRRPFIGGQDCPMENWPSNKDELDAILNIPTSILICFFSKRRFRFCSPLRRLSSHCDVVHFYGRTLTTRRLTSPSMLIASITVELSFSNKPTSTSSS